MKLVKRGSKFKQPITKKISMEKTATKDSEAYEIVACEIHPPNIICPDCGGITLEGFDFCDKCGGEINSVEESS